MSTPCPAPIVVRLHPHATDVSVHGARDLHPSDAERPVAVAHAVGRTLSERDFYLGLELDAVNERAEALADVRCTDGMTCRFPTLRAMMDDGLEIDDVEPDPDDSADLAADAAAIAREQELAAAWAACKAAATEYVAGVRAARSAVAS